MNDEIKEILNWLKDEYIYIEDYGYQYKRISLKETKQLLDYITNLQRERDNFKMSLDESQEVIVDYKQENERIEKEWFDKTKQLGELSSRIYKAIEFIKEKQKVFEWYDTDLYWLLNILQNGSDSQ